MSALLLAGLLAAASFRDCDDVCPTMLVVPAGRFTMGAAPGVDEREGVTGDSLGRAWPAHTAQVPAFALGRTHVTRGEFAAFIRATGYRMPDRCYVATEHAPSNAAFEPGEDPNHWGMMETTGKGWWDPGFAQTDADPVVCVSWYDAQAYAAWLSGRTGHRYRLPSDTEWEYAARAGTTAVRFWGDARADACRNANVSDEAMLRGLHVPPSPRNHFACDDGYVYTAPGARFRPNAFGLFDMIGNAWEWTADCWNERTNDISQVPVDGSPWIEAGCPRHVERGGAWGFNAWNTSSAYRNHNFPTSHAATIGFRIARDLDPGEVRPD